MPEKPKTPEAKEIASTAVTTLEGNEPEHRELVFTVKKSSGEVMKIEELDKSGGRREFSEEEYAGLAACAADATALMSLQASGYDALAAVPTDPYEAGYYHGLADAAAAGASGYTPEELAYYQGMADYAASLG